MKKLAIALLLATSLFGATPNNDASCDIGQLPAATLLLPYFEVDLADPLGETTLFTVTNVTHVEQVAHVTLWTDYAYPVADFDIFLTGYDVQSINLYDVIALGEVAPPLSTGFGRPGSPEGQFSSDDANPLVDENSCRRLQVRIDDKTRTRLRRAFTTGVIEECATAGGVHKNAIGYVTIDVVRACNGPRAGEAGFIDALLFENALTGDYQQVHWRDNSAQGAPLVHIRAIPEDGGQPTFARTFYSEYQPPLNHTRDARQPLPSAFAVRWIDGGAGQFETKLKVWREKISGRPCEPLPPVTDVVRFDEDGNSVTFEGGMPALPATSLVDVSDARLIPAMPGEIAGWTYLNLGAQAWVVGSMRAEGRFSVDVEATALGNGCSPPFERGAQIGPAPDFNVVPTTGNDESCDIAVLPAATLLLPYFEIDLRKRAGENTLFTVTNTTATPRVAHVTLWTDYAYPVLSFDLALGAYDAQSVNLYDVIVLGNLPPSCSGTPAVIRGAMRNRIQQALTIGRAQTAGTLPLCDRVGSTGHVNNNALGYATIDVVGTCTTLNATEPAYYDAIAFDNVLTGDYQQVHAGKEFAQGSPLVHVRAIPEGGAAGPFKRTFYRRFQSAANPTRDARQPLPSAFAARYIHGEAGSFETNFKIWSEGATGANAACNQYATNDSMRIRELVAFDEEENAQGDDPGCAFFCPPSGIRPTGSYPFGPESDLIPMVEDAVAGWLYLNLSGSTEEPARQTWVTTSMRAEGRYSIDVDATALGNGCSPAPDLSEVTDGNAVIGPAPNTNQP